MAIDEQPYKRGEQKTMRFPVEHMGYSHLELQVCAPGRHEADVTQSDMALLATRPKKETMARSAVEP